MSSNSPSNSNSNNDQEGFPVQRHAGKVGYGPNYHSGPSLADKIAGYKEELHGKIAHKPQLVKEGHDRVTGETKRRERLGLDDENQFAAQQQTQSPKSERPQTGDSPQSFERGSMKSGSAVSSIGNEKSAGAPKGEPSHT